MDLDEILETIAHDGLPGPWDYDVALDAIQSCEDLHARHRGVPEVGESTIVGIIGRLAEGKITKEDAYKELTT